MTQKKISGYTIFLEKLLGKGSYGSVYKGAKDGTNFPVAVKIIKKKDIDSDEYMKAALLSQIQILQTIKSENVVALYDVMESTQNYYIIQELCDGDLENYLQKQSKIQQGQAIQFLKQICNGFLSLVRQGIVHRDMKPANIMLSKGQAKIGDFGFAKKNSNKRLKIQSSVGTPLYMSPQILKSEPYTSKCDIWALGFIFYEMIHGQTPWTARSQYQLVKNIQNKEFKLFPNLQENTKDFIKKCLKINESNRISWDQLFVHPIFNGYFDQYKSKNTQFQNKLKSIMSELRFRINHQNIDLKKLFSSLGFTKNQELNFKDFSLFLRAIHPNISSEEEVYFYQKMDKNNDGSISIKQLEEQMEKNHISLTSMFQSQLVENLLFGSQSQETHQESFGKKVKEIFSSQLQYKVKKCFIKLYRILSLKKLTLYRTFVAYDSDRSGQLGFEQFTKILKRLDSSFTQEQMLAIFEFIDKDHSKSLQFDELNSYYCKVNGIPQGLDLPPEYHFQKMKGKTK